MMCNFWFYAFQACNCYTIVPLCTETYRFSVDKNKCKYVRSKTLLKIRNWIKNHPTHCRQRIQLKFDTNRCLKFFPFKNTPRKNGQLFDTLRYTNRFEIILDNIFSKKELWSNQYNTFLWQGKNIASNKLGAN